MRNWGSSPFYLAENFVQVGDELGQQIVQITGLPNRQCRPVLAVSRNVGGEGERDEGLVRARQDKERSPGVV